MDFPVLLFLKSGLAALVILLLPGGAFLAWRPAPDRDFPEWLAEAVGLSIALTALAALFFWLVQRPVTGGGLLGLYAGLALFGLTGKMLHRRTRLFGPGRWLFLFLLLALIGWRFYQVRGLAFPPWVDAPHHVLIVRKILEVGGLPADLNPYLPVPFFYHFGFHVLTALFAALSGAALEQAALWMGQLLNALISLSLYYLGRKVWPEPARAGLAALLSGVVSQMPAYYATGGRYSLLCGLVLLPLAMGAALGARRPGRSVFPFVQQALLTAGTGLAHYFAAGLLGIFALALLGAGAWTAVWGKIKGRETILRPLAGFLAGAVILLPWLLWLWGPAKPYFAVQFNSPVRPLDQTYFSGYGPYLVYLLGPLRNYFLILLALPGLVWAWREPRLRPLAGWGLLLGLGVIPWGFRISPFRPDHLAIVLFLPVCLLAAHFAWEAFVRLKRRRLAPYADKIALTLLLALVIWGLQETRFIIKPETILAGPDDRQAIRWLADNTSARARFLIRAAPWQWGIYRGLDGGFWITPLTGRWSSLPPLLYGFGGPELIDQINQRVKPTLQMAGCDPAFWDLVRSQGLTHVYTREGEGALAPRTLAACPGLTLVYRQGPVYLFKLP
ncbi:MAG: hypothetical protein HY892_04770 [Deltaproteobacteria bacterium]|nr:hypothetical protein [Deltaproteobacteria bacterium]